MAKVICMPLPAGQVQPRVMNNSGVLMKICPVGSGAGYESGYEWGPVLRGIDSGIVAMNIRANFVTEDDLKAFVETTTTQIQTVEVPTPIEPIYESSAIFASVAPQDVMVGGFLVLCFVLGMFFGRKG